jgi:NitT/TauT family transport system ATP-binding protein
LGRQKPKVEDGKFKMADYKLDVRNVTKTFFKSKTGEEVVALKDINLKVKEKEFVCIIGPSGCGKTTLLRIIAGLDEATKGEVYVDGKMSKGPGPEKGMVFQEFALFPWRTVQKNIEFGLEYRGLPHKERKDFSDKYVRLVNLEGWGDRYPHELSGGMKQRVAIARALANDPEVLIMDEPFGSLDSQTRNMLQTELLDIWEETGKTIIFVSHNIDEAVYLADRVVVLTSLPAQIKDIVDIEIPRPRDRTTAVFQKVRKGLLAEVLKKPGSAR